MAEPTTSLNGKTFAQIDREAIDRYNRLLEESLAREKKLHRHYEWRGNKLPPFNIEPMPLERQRLASPMTAEDRAARKQWLLDQKLSPNEPRYIPELYPKNPIRRLLAIPWDMSEKVVKGVLGEAMGKRFRFYGPKITGAAFVAWGCWYHLKYHPQTWEATKGWHMYENRTPIYPGDPSWPHAEEKEHDAFYDRGFKGQTNLKI